MCPVQLNMLSITPRVLLQSLLIACGTEPAVFARCPHARISSGVHFHIPTTCAGRLDAAEFFGAHLTRKEVAMTGTDDFLKNAEARRLLRISTQR